MNVKPDDIVWVNLGKTYGWWPAQVWLQLFFLRLSKYLPFTVIMTI